MNHLKASAEGPTTGAICSGGGGGSSLTTHSSSSNTFSGSEHEAKAALPTIVFATKCNDWANNSYAVHLEALKHHVRPVFCDHLEVLVELQLPVQVLRSDSLS